MVINMLNMSQHMKLQRASFGGEPSEEIDAYRGLDKFIDTPRGTELRKIVDPWEYRRYLTQPKLIILGTNDRYWPLDACDLYWNDLVGEKYLIYVPNNGHDLRDRARVVAGIEALNRRVITGQPLPKLEWKFADADKQVRLNVTSDVPPSRVKIWSARSATRDFRDSEWTESEATAASGQFTHEQPVPASGYAAFFGEAVFNEGTEKQFWLSTNIRIITSQVEAAGGK
jgi:PhoPQ-activated pathogenicity-related protein